jgi:hypothetical protein
MPFGTEELRVIIILGILTSVVAGLLSAIATLAGDRWLARRRRVSMQRRFEGEYHLYPKGSKQRTDELVKITCIGDRCFRIKCECPRWSWSSDITLDEFNPEHGSGVFQYQNSPSWGQHTVHFNPHDNSVTVCVVTVVHKPEYSNWYVLKRVTA